MITRGIVIGVGETIKDSTTDKEIIKYKVRMPLFNGSGDSPGSTPDNELQEAYVASIPGLLNTVNVGDSVYVGFIDNDYSNPVIIGTVSASSSSLMVSSSSLSVLNSTSLSSNTIIGDITYEMLLGVIRWWRAGNYSSSGGESDVAYITINSPTGTFTVEQLAALTGNTLSQIIYNNAHYTLGYKDSTTRRYVTNILSSGKNQYIDVNLTTRAWTHSAVLNEVLQAHINSTSIHVTQNERNYWNDKVTCAIDENNSEKLILTKENLL